jgi:hypothetical protein
VDEARATVLSDISGKRAFEVAMDVLDRLIELGRMRRMAVMMNKTVARKS